MWNPKKKRNRPINIDGDCLLPQGEGEISEGDKEVKT